MTCITQWCVSVGGGADYVLKQMRLGVREGQCVGRLNPSRLERMFRERLFSTHSSDTPLLY